MVMESSEEEEEEYVAHEWITPQSSVSAAFQSHTEKGIRSLCSDLLDLKDAVDHLCSDMHSKYRAFLRLHEEVVDVEHELIALQKHVSAQGILVQDLINGVSSELRTWQSLDPDRTKPDPVCAQLADLLQSASDPKPSFLETLDTMIVEHRLEEALVLLDSEERTNIQQLQSDELLKRMEILEDQLVAFAQQSSLSMFELKKALAGLVKLDKPVLAHKLLLKAYASKLQKRVESFIPSCSALRPLRRAVKRSCTREGELREEDGGVAEWNEEFSGTAVLVPNRDRGGGFNSWVISFVVYNGPRSKATILGMATLNLADYPSALVGDINLILPLELPSSSVDSPPILYISLGLHEPGPTRASPERALGPSTPVPLSPSSGDLTSVEKDETSVLKAGLRKMKVLRQLVPSQKSKKTRNDESSSEAGRCSPPQIVSDTEAVLASPLPPPPFSPEKDGSSVLKAGLRKVKILRGLVSSKSKMSAPADEGSDSKYPGDTDSIEIDIGSEASEGDIGDTTVRKSFSYGSLTLANFMRNDEGKSDDWVFYSERRSDVDFYPKGGEVSTSTALEEKVVFSAKRSLLPWRKRKLSYRSLKAKGEPLLKKAFAEEGGDDIDFDRRRLTSSDESLSAMGLKDMEASGTGTPAEDLFGDDHFVVGSWESKEITSRDGHMKLSTDVFFASIDQRSERAAGESACAVLVVAVADWFQFNQNIMPVRSQLDSLIREGSVQWRTMYAEKSYLDRFPDGHFDLDTVLEAKVRPLTVVRDKSFVGFFHPEGDDLEKESGFEFLHGSMSFDGIWDEIMKAAEECELDRPMVYIVSWNDHFFVLKVEKDAYYIVDTLGERLYEGCNQAYILKFDENTIIHQLSVEDKTNAEEDTTSEETSSGTCRSETVCKGKEACKEYIKSFLAAIPIRELQEDIKKGRVGSGSATLHQRLQIEFHYTEPSEEKGVDPTGEIFPEITWPPVAMSEMEGFSAWTVELSTAPAVAVA